LGRKHPISPSGPRQKTRSTELKKEVEIREVGGGRGIPSTNFRKLTRVNTAFDNAQPRQGTGKARRGGGTEEICVGLGPCCGKREASFGEV